MKKPTFIYLILIVFFLGGVGFFLNYFQIVDIPLVNTIEKSIQTSTEDESIYSNEEAFLLKEKENQKIIEAINIQKNEIEKKTQELADRELGLEKLALELEEKQKNIDLQQNAIAKEQEDKNNYQVKVSEIADQFLNMPPERAVERLVALKDDILISDILNRIDEKAKENNAISIVPYFYSLMPQEDAARIIRKNSIDL